MFRLNQVYIYNQADLSAIFYLHAKKYKKDTSSKCSHTLGEPYT